MMGGKMIVLEMNNVNNVIRVEDLPVILEKVTKALGGRVGGPEGVIISGRMPVWVFVAVAHLLHPRPMVATFDPRLDGGVVVMSHSPAYKVGDVVPLPSEPNSKVEVAKVVVEV